MVSTGRKHIGIPCFIALHFMALRRECFFYKLKVCDNPVLNKSIDANFSTFSHFVSLCHILIILTIFQAFSLLLLFVMVICGQSEAISIEAGRLPSAK